MNRMKQWFLLFALAGSGLVLPSCASTLLNASRDAAVTGAARFVEEVTFQILNSRFGQGEE